MLRVTIPSTEYWDEANERFVVVNKEQVLQLEHSLVSISRWESKWRKPFLSPDTKTREETLDYIRCMTITQNVDPDTYQHIPDNIVNQINEYIAAPMTATTFAKERGRRGGGGEFVTSELIYYWMISFSIPAKYEKWHLNRLLTLIKICEHKNRPNRKMGKRDIFNQNRAINARNRQRFNSKG